ncbi:MAG TPA: YiiX/YebB-like N1pC/P60 family cysteine hydrolase [Mobilitalea sp.]|nr:YiiX/YebB-like N1pC/P60 family cysteine hydrolase [Mobilitalea sp.]
MKIKKLIVSLLLFSMVFGLGNVQVHAATQSSDAFNTESVAKKWSEINKKLVVRSDAKDKAVTRNSALTASVSLSGNTSGGGSSSQSTGTYPTRKGVILVTADKFKGILPLGHAAIIYSASYVVEALSDGVVLGKNNWNTTRETCYGVTVSSTTATQDAQAADYCYNQLNKPYNYNYFNMGTREKFYCSHLVWAAFKDLFGIDLNTSFADIVIGNTVISQAIHPLELVDTSLTYTIYVK